MSGDASSDLERFVLITGYFAVVEPPYNALAFRLNEPMPKTDKLVLKQRPAGIGEPVPLMVGWETLTNAENPF